LVTIVEDVTATTGDEYEPELEADLFLVPFGEVQRQIVTAVLRPLRLVIENFPEGKLKDQVDTLSGAINSFITELTGDFTKAMGQSRVKTIAPGLRGNKDLW